MRRALAVGCLLLISACSSQPPAPVMAKAVVGQHRYFALQALDEDGQPLAGVRLRTVHHVGVVTDENGLAAFYEPGLMGKQVFFFAEREGYAAEVDELGIAGTRLLVEEGHSGQVLLHKISDAPPPASPGPEQAARLRSSVPLGKRCFELFVRDSADLRGIPLAKVEIEDGPRYFTDSQGFVAVCDPDVLGTRIRFALRSDGYEDPHMRFNVMARAGNHATVELQRADIARRLYRATGGGIYRDSVMLDKPVPLRHPVLNARVLGQDSVQSVVFGGKALFVYGDTLRPEYPLGNFHVTAAVADLPGSGGLSPAAGVDLHYFEGSDGFVRPMAPPTGSPRPRVTWLNALSLVQDEGGADALYAAYAHVNDELLATEVGLVRYDPARQTFFKALRLEPSVSMPHGHPSRVHHASGDYLYYQVPIRVRAESAALLDPQRWEAFTPFVKGSSLLLRDRDGVLDYAFRSGTRPANDEELAQAGVPPQQRLFAHLRDADSGRPLRAHLESSRAYNPYRKRFIELVQRVSEGPAPLSEIWYAEGDTPLGPWVFAKKIVSFERHTFYNPRQHPFLDADGGRRIFFEGTYTNQFSGAEPTPRYDYNQLMYSLDVTDARLEMPVPVYEAVDRGQRRLLTKLDLKGSAGSVVTRYLAFERPGPGRIKLAYVGAACDRASLAAVPETSPYPAAFYALSEPGRYAGQPLTPLSAEPWAGEDIQMAAARGLGFVLESPLEVALPVGEFVADRLADAGPDQCVRAGRFGTATVTVSAATYGADDRMQYRWRLPHSTLAGPSQTLSLARGDHVFVLEAQLGSVVDTDSVVVHVE